MLLHHYALSPFSEKIRLMLGYQQQSWSSFVVAPLPPRPVTDALTGGYRRIPILQQGADVLCDSKLIAHDLSRQLQAPELDYWQLNQEQQQLADYLDSEFLFVALNSCPPLKLLGLLKQSLSVWGLARFMWDRLGIAKEAKEGGSKGGYRRYRQQLQSLEQQLQQPFLYGDSPNYVDFCLYPSLWFVMAKAEQSLPEPLPKLTAWFKRMQAFGHGDIQELSRGEVARLAQEHTPKTLVQTDNHPMLDKPVSVGPLDYARDQTQGTLVAVTAHRWVIKQKTERFGDVHIHFPNTGYALRDADGQMIPDTDALEVSQ